MTPGASPTSKERYREGCASGATASVIGVLGEETGVQAVGRRDPSPPRAMGGAKVVKLHLTDDFYERSFGESLNMWAKFCYNVNHKTKKRITE